MKKQSEWEYVDGEGIWKNYKNKRTGEFSLKRFKPRKVSKFDECKNHYFELVDGRNAQCKNCGFGQPIVWGLQIVKDGKVINQKKI